MKRSTFFNEFTKLLYRSQQDCFEKEYELLAKESMLFCTGLLDNVHDEMEVRHLMRWREKKFEPFKDVHELAFIRLGFKYNVKEVRRIGFIKSK